MKQKVIYIQSTLQASVKSHFINLALLLHFSIYILLQDGVEDALSCYMEQHWIYFGTVPVYILQQYTESKIILLRLLHPC